MIKDVKNKSVINQTFKWLFIAFIIASSVYFSMQYYINNIQHKEAVTTKYRRSEPAEMKVLNNKIENIRSLF